MIERFRQRTHAARLAPPAVIVALALFQPACGAAVTTEVMRPAQISGTRFGNTYEVRPFEVAVAAPEARVETAVAPPESAAVAGPLGVEVSLALPTQSSEQRWERVAAESASATAQQFEQGIRDAIARSPNSNQRLVASGAGLSIGGVVLQSDVREQWRRFSDACSRTVNGRAQSFRCNRIDVQATAMVRVRFVVRSREGQVIFDQELSDSANTQAQGHEALDGGPSSAPSTDEPALLAMVRDRMTLRLARMIVPWRELLVIDWFDSSEFPNARAARDAMQAGNLAEADRVLSRILGGDGAPRLSVGGDVPKLLANRSAVRVALGRYHEALADMELAVSGLPGCVARSRIEQTRELARQQALLREQGAAE